MSRHVRPKCHKCGRRNVARYQTRQGPICGRCRGVNESANTPVFTNIPHDLRKEHP
jgi:hypothetical protein